MEMANCTSPLRFRLPNCRDGKHGSRRMESLSKKSGPGISVARAYIFAIPTATCWRLPHLASGRSIERLRRSFLFPICPSELSFEKVTNGICSFLSVRFEGEVTGFEEMHLGARNHECPGCSQVTKPAEARESLTIGSK